MNDLEDRLAELMKTGVGDPPGRVTVRAVRRQRARRHAAVLGVVTAVAAVAIVGAGLGLRPGGSGQQVAGPASYGGVPRYYVAETYPHGRLLASVRDTTTGAVTGTVRCPYLKAPALIYPIVSDAHQRFFMVCAATSRGPAPARIYQFQLTPSGQVRDETLLPGGQLGGVNVGFMAVSPDGSELAVSVSPPTAGPPISVQARVMVLNTRTGARTTWRNAPAAQHRPRFRILGLSYAANGRELVFLGTRLCGGGVDPAPCRPGDQQLRALSPPARGGWLSSGRILLRQAEPSAATQLAGAVVSADGLVATLVTESVPPKPQPSTVTVTQVQLGAHRQHVLYRADGSSQLSPEVFFSTDWSGRHFLIDAGSESHPVAGRIDQGRLVRLKPFQGWVSYLAW
jgi:hypothetical protein